MSKFAEYTIYLRGRHEHNPLFIYLDQNILIDIFEGRYKLSQREGMHWIYSGENLDEIRRSGVLSPLGVLKDIDARKIEFIFNGDEITDSAYILKSIDPYAVYEDYISNCKKHEAAYGDNQLNHEIAAFLFGANNIDESRMLSDDIRLQIEQITGPLNNMDSDTQKYIDEVLLELEKQMQYLKEKKRDPESIRKALGYGKNGVSSIGEINTIEKICLTLKNVVPANLTCDNLFMFEPPYMEEFEVWSEAQGIVSAYLILSRLGYMPDKGITNPGKLKNIISDSWHVAYGAYCDGIMSRDPKQLAKAKAIYDYKKITSLPISVEWNEYLGSE